jgi:hypothetical protein
MTEPSLVRNVSSVLASEDDLRLQPNREDRAFPRLLGSFFPPKPFSVDMLFICNTFQFTVGRVDLFGAPPPPILVCLVCLGYLEELGKYYRTSESQNHKKDTPRAWLALPPQTPIPYPPSHTISVINVFSVFYSTYISYSMSHHLSS